MHHLRSPLRLAAVGAALLAACSNSDLNGPINPFPNQQVSQAEPPSQDQLDRQVQGFGGMFLDRNGIPNVYLQAGADRRQAEVALAPYLQSRGLQPGQVKVLPAQFLYRQLESWFHEASPEALALDGAVFVDNDEAGNRVHIGVTDLSAQANVRTSLARLGIPAEAAVVERADPILQLATLQNVVDRPVRAGVQINFPGYLCSVGFNATSGTEQSFVTASHCTNTQGGVEDTPYWQPLQSTDPTQIATEVADPSYFRNANGCPRGRRCRFSDASRAAYIDGSNQALGAIARTSGPNNGSLDIVGSFTIVGEDLNDHFTIGTVINKVGRTTGWTQGTVSNTCVDTGVSGTNIVQLCQTFVSSSATIVLGGDSGSGTWKTAGSNTVTLTGILWGGNSNGTLFVFSPLKNVERELGPLSTF
ncbi:MAG TPA: hypothetical protein VGQ73_06475 [Gemmatimonadales bacterium]|jgi:hypothetical protein|nr:hypothetical protein [Gemmatimonadales bacterium]